MATIQTLKKKLRGVNSTRKLSKAMKTVSTIKFSRLNSVFGEFSSYGRECQLLYDRYGDELNSILPPSDPSAPELVILMTGNKGMCGSFNNELVSFTEQYLQSSNIPCTLAVCGKQAVLLLKEKGITFDSEFSFDDIPNFGDSLVLFDSIVKLRYEGKISDITVIYPKYHNMMKQTPTAISLFCHKGDSTDNSTMMFPDRETVVASVAKKVFLSVIYNLLLETAIGAQASTLMTMRSAYDTATEYTEQLEMEINRKRQSEVTSDVIETSSEV